MDYFKRLKYHHRPHTATITIPRIYINEENKNDQKLYF